MHRVVAGVIAIAIAVAACGRIRFDPRPGGDGAGSGTPGDSALVVNDAGVAIGCGFIPCDAGSIACCVAGQTSCAPDGMCGGASYMCGECVKTLSCCLAPDGGSYCQTICGGL